MIERPELLECWYEHIVEPQDSWKDRISESTMSAHHKIHIPPLFNMLISLIGLKKVRVSESDNFLGFLMVDSIPGWQDWSLIFGEDSYPSATPSC